MGGGMASNFLKRGHEVFVWNRDKEKLSSFVAQGGKIANSPKEACEKADIIFEVTANNESSQSVWLGEEGILAGATTEKVLITSATLSIKWIDELARLCEEKGFTFFDMPLTGGRDGAEAGKLTFLVGGNEEKLNEIRSDLSSVSQKVWYFGKQGSGMRYKLILNMIQAVHIVALGEALKIAENNGLNIKTVGDTLAERPGGIVTNLAWRDYQDIPMPPNFSVKWLNKDLKYAKELAGTLQLPLLDDVIQKYKEAAEKGKGEEDWTIVNHLD